MSELRYLASRTIFSDSPSVRIITWLIKVFPLGCSSLFTGDMISFYSIFDRGIVSNESRRLKIGFIV